MVWPTRGAPVGTTLRDTRTSNIIRQGGGDEWQCGLRCVIFSRHLSRPSSFISPQIGGFHLQRHRSVPSAHPRMQLPQAAQASMESFYAASMVARQPDAAIGGSSPAPQSGCDIVCQDRPGSHGPNFTWYRRLCRMCGMRGRTRSHVSFNTSSQPKWFAASHQGVRRGEPNLSARGHEPQRVPRVQLKARIIKPSVVPAPEPVPRNTYQCAYESINVEKQTVSRGDVVRLNPVQHRRWKDLPGKGDR